MKKQNINPPIRIAWKTLALASAVVAVLAIAPSVRASITFDAATYASQGAGASIAWSHTVGTGADRMLVVGITTESDPDRTVTAVTFGAQALTQVPAARAVNGTTPANASDLWYLPAPAETTDTITVTFSGSVSAGTVAGAVSLFGAVQGPPEAVASYNAGTGSTYSATVATLTDGAWLVDAVNSGTAGATFTPGPGQTRRWYNGGVNHAGAGSTRETRLTTPASAIIDTWTTSGNSRRALSVAAFAPVTYTAPPLAADAGVDKTYNPGTPVTLGGTPAASGGYPLYTYSWSPADGLSSTSVPNPTASPTSTTIYTLTVTDSLNVTASDTVTVTYTVPPLVANAGSDKTYNPGTPVSLGGSPAASGGSTVYTYSWSPADGLSSTSVPNPTASPTSTTTYTLTVTDSFGTTPATDDVTVTYTVLPLVAYAGVDQTVATGIPATLGGTPTASGGSTVYTYSWSPTTGLDDPTAAHPVASPTTTTTYTLTVTDSFGTTPATDDVLVTFGVPNVNLISVDFYKLGGVPCSGDTTLTGTTMKNAVGQIFTGQIGPWNALNIGSYNTNSAISGFLKNAAGTTTTVKLAMGSATGLSDPGGWRCDPNEGSPGGSDKLRSEIAYLYYPTLTANHFVWALTGLTANAHYKLTLFGSGSSTFTNIANTVAGVPDAEGDWNWTDIQADSAGVIAGNLLTTGNNRTFGIYGVQIESIGSGASGYDIWATANAGGQASDLDYDLDGMSNGVEYFMGATGSSFTPNPPVVNTAGVLTVTWPRDPAVTAPFKVQVSDNLTAWTDIVPPDANINTSITTQVTYTLPSGAAKKFCRLVVTP